MSGSAMKIKSYSYSASPACNCTDKVINFINKHMRKPIPTSVSCIPYTQLKKFNFGNVEPEKKDESKPQEIKTEQTISTTNHRESYIDDKHFPCLKEELMKLEAEKVGKGKVKAAYYNLREFEAYSAYAMKSPEYHKTILDNMRKYAKIGMYVGAIYGAMTSDDTMSSFALSTMKCMAFGVMIGTAASLPPLYHEFKKVKEECLNPR